MGLGLGLGLARASCYFTLSMSAEETAWRSPVRDRDMGEG